MVPDVVQEFKRYLECTFMSLEASMTVRQQASVVALRSMLGIVQQAQQRACNAEIYAQLNDEDRYISTVPNRYLVHAMSAYTKVRLCICVIRFLMHVHKRYKHTFMSSAQEDDVRIRTVEANLQAQLQSTVHNQQRTSILRKKLHLVYKQLCVALNSPDTPADRSPTSTQIKGSVASSLSSASKPCTRSSLANASFLQAPSTALQRGSTPTMFMQQVMGLVDGDPVQTHILAAIQQHKMTVESALKAFRGQIKQLDVKLAQYTSQQQDIQTQMSKLADERQHVLDRARVVAEECDMLRQCTEELHRELVTCRSSGVRAASKAKEDVLKALIRAVRPPTRPSTRLDAHTSRFRLTTTKPQAWDVKSSEAVHAAQHHNEHDDSTQHDGDHRKLCYTILRVRLQYVELLYDMLSTIPASTDVHSSSQHKQLYMAALQQPLAALLHKSQEICMLIADVHSMSRVLSVTIDHTLLDPDWSWNMADQTDSGGPSAVQADHIAGCSTIVGSSLSASDLLAILKRKVEARKTTSDTTPARTLTSSKFRAQLKASESSDLIPSRVAPSAAHDRAMSFHGSPASSSAAAVTVDIRRLGHPLAVRLFAARKAQPASPLGTLATSPYRPAYIPDRMQPQQHAKIPGVHVPRALPKLASKPGMGNAGDQKKQSCEAVLSIKAGHEQAAAVQGNTSFQHSAFSSASGGNGPERDKFVNVCDQSDACDQMGMSKEACRSLCASCGQAPAAGDDASVLSTVSDYMSYPYQPSASTNVSQFIIHENNLFL